MARFTVTTVEHCGYGAADTRVVFSPVAGDAKARHVAIQFAGPEQAANFELGSEYELSLSFSKTADAPRAPAVPPADDVATENPPT